MYIDLCSPIHYPYKGSTDWPMMFGFRWRDWWPRFKACVPISWVTHFFWQVVSPSVLQCAYHPQEPGCITPYPNQSTSWLVVGPPLWKIWKSIGMMIIPNIWENKKWQPNHQPARVFFSWLICSMMFLHILATKLGHFGDKTGYINFIDGALGDSHGRGGLKT